MGIECYIRKMGLKSGRYEEAKVQRHFSHLYESTERAVAMASVLLLFLVNVFRDLCLVSSR